MDMTEYVNGEYKMVAKVPLLSDAIRILEVKRLEIVLVKRHSKTLTLIGTADGRVFNLEH